MNTSKSIKKCLEETGIQKKKLASLLGVSAQTVSALMRSDACSTVMLVKLAAAFKMKVSEFVRLGE